MPIATPIANQAPTWPASTPKTAPSTAPRARPSPACFDLLVITFTPAASTRFAPGRARRLASPSVEAGTSPGPFPRPSLGLRRIPRLRGLVADLPYLAQQL